MKSEGGQLLCGPYTVTAKLTFLSNGDRAGIAVAWNDATITAIEIQPNVYWQDLEIRYPSSLGGVVNDFYANHGSLHIAVNRTYFLQARVTSSGPGKGSVTIWWSSNGGATYSQLASITGLSNVSGLAAMGTAGPNLPQTAFGYFEVKTG